MTPTSLMDYALQTIAKNRSSSSWLAGSVVIRDLIQRQPQDVDIHHISAKAMLEAFEADKRLLLESGFCLGKEEHEEGEFQSAFEHSDGTVILNWVLEDHLPPDGLLIAHDLGACSNQTDVLARKVEMYLECGDPKHKNDLISVSENLAIIPNAIAPETIAKMLRQIGLPNANSLLAKNHQDGH
ncbi:MAG: hypothetical protein COB78_06965 [Hyphomicrobiales bacterium]|nr:MAG: hypothetical protein COB78_06965 [Hyphomicrobiales bacterium]